MDLTRVVCNTLPSRGKSFTPVSRIAMLELNSEMLDCNEFTHPASGFAIGARPYHCPSKSSINRSHRWYSPVRSGCVVVYQVCVPPTSPEISRLKAAPPSPSSGTRSPTPQNLKALHSHHQPTTLHTHTHKPSHPSAPPPTTHDVDPRQEVPRARRYVLRRTTSPFAAEPRREKG